MILRRSFLTLATGSALLELLPFLSARADFVSPFLDHIILGCKDLDAGIAFMQEKSGYRAAIGGSHPGRGTRNALLALGGQRYLEILAPDPEQPALTWHAEIAQLNEPLLVGWAIRHNNLEAYAKNLRDRGRDYIGPIFGSRTRPDGQTFRWKTLTPADDREGIRPFYIEWDEHSAHPSSDAPGACLLLDFRSDGHLIDEPPPRPNLRKMVVPGKTIQIHAKIAGLFGEFELASKAIPAEAWTTR